MPTFDLICLADSYKYGHRCIAGLRTDGGGWVRPVSSREHGELPYWQYRLQDGSEPRILDVIRVGLSELRPSPCQPEDWLVDASPWRLMARPAPPEAVSILGAARQRGNLLFGDDFSSMASEDLEHRAVMNSLALVEPQDVWWQVGVFNERKKVRALFRLGRHSYDLPLTDPVFTARVRRLEPGDHQDDELGMTSGTRYLFVISLSKPWDNGRCYKLVAGVIPVPFEPAPYRTTTLSVVTLS